MKQNVKSLVVVTRNPSKAAEIASMTGWPTEPVDLEIREIQSMNVEEVAREKALVAYRILQKPVVVDDTGMSIHSLNGLPGALVSWFLDTLGPAGVVTLVAGAEDRSAVVSTCVAYADESGSYTFVGTVHGTLTKEPRGANGFGYDPIFIPEGETQTYAEMTPEKKNAISMRRQALAQLHEHLARLPPA